MSIRPNMRYLDLIAEYEIGIRGIFRLCSFHTDTSTDIDGSVNYTLYFIGSLYNNTGTFVAIHPKSKGKTAAEYLQRVGITGILDQIFIEKKTSVDAILISRRVVLSNTPEETLKKLQQHISRLKFIKWI